MACGNPKRGIPLRSIENSMLLHRGWRDFQLNGSLFVREAVYTPPRNPSMGQCATKA